MLFSTLKAASCFAQHIPFHHLSVASPYSIAISIFLIFPQSLTGTGHESDLTSSISTQILSSDKKLADDELKARLSRSLAAMPKDTLEQACTGLEPALRVHIMVSV